MTELQKVQIRTMREQGIGFADIAKRMDIPRETVKSFCRRNGIGSVSETPLIPSLSSRRTRPVSAVPVEKALSRLVAEKNACSAVTSAAQVGGVEIRIRSGAGSRRCTPSSAWGAAGSLPRMETSIGNIAHMTAISGRGSERRIFKTEMMNKKEFQAEKLYQMGLFIARTMLENGLITEDEFSEIDTILLDLYRPVLSSLLAGKPLI